MAVMISPPHTPRHSTNKAACGSTKPWVACSARPACLHVAHAACVAQGLWPCRTWPPQRRFLSHDQHSCSEQPYAACTAFQDVKHSTDYLCTCKVTMYQQHFYRHAFLSLHNSQLCNRAMGLCAEHSYVPRLSSRHTCVPHCRQRRLPGSASASASADEEPRLAAPPAAAASARRLPPACAPAACSVPRLPARSPAQVWEHLRVYRVAARMGAERVLHAALARAQPCTAANSRLQNL